MQDLVINLGPNRLLLSSAGSAFKYKRYIGYDLQAESTIISDRQDVVIGIFPIPPLRTPKAVAKNIYLKFKSHVVLDQKSESIVYAKIPIEIGVYRQSEDEELMLELLPPPTTTLVGVLELPPLHALSSTTATNQIACLRFPLSSLEFICRYLRYRICKRTNVKGLMHRCCGLRRFRNTQ